MDAIAYGKKGGRPSKRAAAKKIAAEEVREGRQSVISFGKVTISHSTVNVTFVQGGATPTPTLTPTPTPTPTRTPTPPSAPKGRADGEETAAEDGEWAWGDEVEEGGSEEDGDWEEEDEVEEEEEEGEEEEGEGDELDPTLLRELEGELLGLQQETDQDPPDEEELSVLTRPPSKKARLTRGPARGKHTSYSPKERKAILDLLMKNEGNKQRTVRMVKTVRGYEKFTRQHLIRWTKVLLPQRKRGPKISADFESEVLAKLVLKITDVVDGVESLAKIANVTHSYAVIREAARLTRNSLPWKNETGLMKLKFSNNWVQGFLRRAGLRRRRTTTTAKAKPPVSDIRKRMSEIQTTISSGGFALHEIVNSDETGVCFGAPPKNQYITSEETRGAAPPGDEKARFTALLYSAADGCMGPPFVIIKCNIKGPDLSRARVLANLLKTPSFNNGDWETKEWTRELTLQVRGKVVKTTYKRPYLINKVTLAVVTIQHRAWMDSAGMTMWADVQLAPLWKGAKRLMVWDNCGPHGVAAVLDVFKAHNITVEALPANVTDELQVREGERIVFRLQLLTTSLFQIAGDGLGRQRSPKGDHSKGAMHFPPRVLSELQGGVLAGESGGEAPGLLQPPQASPS
jgi:hypothetical protein